MSTTKELRRCDQVGDGFEQRDQSSDGFEQRDLTSGGFGWIGAIIALSLLFYFQSVKFYLKVIGVCKLFYT